MTNDRSPTGLSLLCINKCPCPVFTMPPRKLADFEADAMHLHDGCRVYHDGKVCPAPPEQGRLFG